MLLLISPRQAARVDTHTLPGGLFGPRESAASVRPRRWSSGGSAVGKQRLLQGSSEGQLLTFLIKQGFIFYLFFLTDLMRLCFCFSGKQDYKKTKLALRATRLKAEAKKNSSGFRVNLRSPLLSTTSTRYCSLCPSRPSCVHSTMTILSVGNLIIHFHLRPRDAAWALLWKIPERTETSFMDFYRILYLTWKKGRHNTKR